MDKVSISEIAQVSFPEAIYCENSGINFEVYPKVPTKTIVDGIQWVIDNLIDGVKPFISYPLKTILESIGAVTIFTNIQVDTLTPETIYAVYDNLTEIISLVYHQVNPTQLAFYSSSLQKTIESIVQYKNSAMGIIDALSAGAQTTTETLQENMDFLKDEGSLTQIRQLLQTAGQLGMITENK